MFNEETWLVGEKLAQEYMKNQGYKILYTNFSCVGVELDIVAVLSAKKQFKAIKEKYRPKIKKLKSIKKKLNILKILKSIKSSLTDLLIVTEVKARRTNKFGNGFEAVDLKKQKNIIRGAQYLLKMKEFSNMQIRFDVASVDDDVVTYFKDAFQAK